MTDQTAPIVQMDREYINGLQREYFGVLSDMLRGRTEILRKAGMSFGNNRDLFNTLGYEIDPSFASYYWRYKRTSAGKRLIKIHPQYSWKKHPTVSENDEQSLTSFEKDWNDFVDKYHIFKLLRRSDILTGIGWYGVIYLGFSGQDLKQEVSKGEKLLYIRPFSSDSAEIASYVTNKNDERYGLPETYKLKMAQQNVTKSTKIEQMEVLVHHSRCIHIVEDGDDSEVLGTPRLEASLNDLQALDYIVGGAGEMFWRGALPGLAFLAKDGYQLPQGDQKTAMETEISKYIHDMQRDIKLAGVDVQSLTTQLASPDSHYDTIITNICLGRGIPKRIFMGSERGELASSQDRNAWGDEIRDRQENFCEPAMLRPLIDRLIEYGVLSEPKDGRYIVEWPSLYSTDPKEMATTAKTIAEAASTYLSGPAANLIPESTFLTKYLDFTMDEVEEIMKNSSVEEIDDDLYNVDIIEGGDVNNGE